MIRCDDLYQSFTDAVAVLSLSSEASPTRTSVVIVVHLYSPDVTTAVYTGRYEGVGGWFVA